MTNGMDEPKMSSQPEKTLIATIEVVGHPIGQPKHAQVARPVAGTRTRCGHYAKWRAMAYPVKIIGEGHKKRPHPIVAWRTTVRTCAKLQWRASPIDQAVRVDIEFRFRRPESHFRKGRNSELLTKAAPKFHSVKPDSDNAHKPVYDSLTDAGVLRDDCLIVGGMTWKRYCEDDPDGILERPGCTITIWKLED